MALLFSPRIGTLTFLVALTTFLSACEDDATTANKTTTTAAISTPVPTTVTVRPALGGFSDGALVTLKSLSGTALGNALVSGGTAVVNLSTYDAPVMVEVTGGIGVKYYDEARGTLQDFGTSDTLVAVVPRLRSPLGVTTVSHAAYALLKAQKAGNVSTSTALDIALANTKAGCAFGLITSSMCTESFAGAGIADGSNVVLTAPAPLGSSTDISPATAAGRYATLLAAHAYIAKDQSQTPWQLASYLAADFRDGTLDGRISKTDTGSALSVPQFAPALANYGTLLKNNWVKSLNAYGVGPVKSANKLFSDVGTLVGNTSALKLSDTTIRTGLTDAKSLVGSFQNTAVAGLQLLDNAKLVPMPKTAGLHLQDSVAPAAEFVANRLVGLALGIDTYENALTYSTDSTNNLFVAQDPSRLTQSQVLTTLVGFQQPNRYGAGSCWADSDAPTSITKVTCRVFDAHGSGSGKPGNNVLFITEYEMQRTAPGQITYSARRLKSTYGALGNHGLEISQPTVANASDVLGSGSISYTKADGSSVSSMTITGTFPSLALDGLSDQFQELAATHTTGSPSTYGLTGLATISLGNAQSIAFNFEQSASMSVDESNGYGSIQSASLVGSIDSNDLKFSGTLTLGSYQSGSSDTYDDRRPTSISFTGAVSNPATVDQSGTYNAAPLTATLTSWIAAVPPAAATSKVGTISFDGDINGAAFLQYGADLPASGSPTQALRFATGTTWLMMEPSWTDGSFATVTSLYDVELRKDTTKTTSVFKIYGSGALVGSIENGTATFTDSSSIKLTTSP